MVQILPPRTNIGSQLGEAAQQGAQQGNQLATQLLPFLIMMQKNRSMFPQGSEGISPQGVPAVAGQQASRGPSQVPQAQQRPPGIFDVKTPQDIEAISRQSMDPQSAQQFWASQNEMGQKNRDRLIKLAEEEGMSQGRISELFDFAAANPQVRTPEQLLGLAKREFGQIGKIPVPGFWSNLIKGGNARETALKQQVPNAQAMIAAGRGQELRSELAEQGLTQTEINYQFYPLSQQTEKAIKDIPNSPFKDKSSIKLMKGVESGVQQRRYEAALKKNPEMIQKQNAKLEQFFKDNVTPKTSLLVLRDQLVNKGYDWRQVNEAINKAFPDKNQLNGDQFAELTELGQAPLPSLSDLFGPRFGERLSAYLQGKK